MSDSPLEKQSHNTGLAEASAMLKVQLFEEESKKIWSQFLPSKISSDTEVISYRAIARAIATAEHRRYGSPESPSRYKDRVRRAILGQRLTVETLNLFAETFDFPASVTAKIQDLINSDVPTDGNSHPKLRNKQLNLTSSFYDVYLNADLKPYRLDCSLVLRALEDDIDYVLASKSEDILSVTLLEGGTSSWEEDLNAYKFTLDYPLKKLESAQIRYTMEISTQSSQSGLVSLRYYVPRSACFYRIFFDDPDTAPESLRVERKFEDDSHADLENNLLVPVHDGIRASLYLDSVYEERVIFHSDSTPSSSIGKA